MRVIQRHSQHRLALGATVDEIIVTAPTHADEDVFKATLEVKYRVTDLGPPATFLGWKVSRTDTGPIHISYPVLIGKSLEKGGLTSCNPRSTPLPRNPDFDDAAASPPLSSLDRLLSQSLMGDLRFLADSTRLEIAFAVAQLEQHLTRPTAQHMLLLKHVLRYLSGTQSHGLLFQQNSRSPLSSYADPKKCHTRGSQ